MPGSHPPGRRSAGRPPAAGRFSPPRLLLLARRLHGLWREMSVAGAGYPVFRRELLHWDREGRRRWRLEEFFGLLALVNLCLTPATLLIFPGLLLAQAIVDEALGLAVAAPAASLVVGERDQRTWSSLRVTSLSSADILLGKTAGLLYLFWHGAGYLALARLIGTLLALPLLALMLTQPGSLPATGGWPLWATGLGLLLLYLAYINRPLINLLFGGCLGLLASTLASTSRRAAALAAVAQLGAALLALGLASWPGWRGQVGLLLGDGVLGDRLADVFAWLLPLGLATIARILLAPALFALAVFRVERWSE